MESRSKHLLHALCAEGVEAQTLARAFEVAAFRSQRVRPVFGFERGDDQEHPETFAAAREVGDETQRVRVRPVEVVNQERKWALAGDRRE